MINHPTCSVDTDPACDDAYVVSSTTRRMLRSRSASCRSNEVMWDSAALWALQTEKTMSGDTGEYISFSFMPQSERYGDTDAAPSDSDVPLETFFGRGGARLDLLGASPCSGIRCFNLSLEGCNVRLARTKLASHGRDLEPKSAWHVKPRVRDLFFCAWPDHHAKRTATRRGGDGERT